MDEASDPAKMPAPLFGGLGRATLDSGVSVARLEVLSRGYIYISLRSGV